VPLFAGLGRRSHSAHLSRRTADDAADATATVALASSSVSVVRGSELEASSGTKEAGDVEAPRLRCPAAGFMSPSETLELLLVAVCSGVNASTPCLQPECPLANTIAITPTRNMVDGASLRSPPAGGAIKKHAREGLQSHGSKVVNVLAGPESFYRCIACFQFAFSCDVMKLPRSFAGASFL
jgi:hypothetical protein